MIERHNKVVKPNDTIFHLGDLAFHLTPEQILELMSKLNGKHVLILGNHDKYIREFRGEQRYRLYELKGRPGSIWHPYNPTLCHYPMISWKESFHGTFQLHGHTHGTVPFDPKVRRLDVGVDCWNFTPVAWEDIVQKLKNVPTPKELADGGTPDI